MVFFSGSNIFRRRSARMIFLLAAIFFVCYFSQSACAAGIVPCTNDCNLCYLIVGILNIFQWLMGALLITVFLLGIIIAGLSYMVSGAFPKLLAFAKNVFSNSLKGFLLALIAWIIINGIMNIVGYKHPLNGKWYQFDCSSPSQITTKNIA